jgi:hypothetical protein
MLKYKEDTMNGYKHYIRTNESNVIIKRFSSAFEDPEEGDICVNENGGRHYNDPVTNERGQCNRQWIGGNEFPRPQVDLDAEWNARPPDPPSEMDMLGQQLVEKDIQMLQLQTDNDVIGQQVVNLDIRLMMGGL